MLKKAFMAIWTLQIGMMTSSQPCSNQVMMSTRKTQGYLLSDEGLTMTPSEYQKQLATSESHLDGLLSDTASALSLLETLTKSFKTVESQTTTFQKQCEGLIQEQKRLEGLAEALDSNLQYYKYLEPVTRRLNAPGAGRLVKSKEFSEMLARIDECVAYMAAHVRT